MTTIDYAIRVATQLQTEGKLESAKIILQSILDVYPKHADTLHLSGIIAYQTGNPNLGIELIQQAIKNDSILKSNHLLPEKNSKLALFHSNLCEMYRQLKMTHLSIQHGECAIKHDANSAIALSNLGIAYYDAKLYDKAETCHKHALAINPKLGTSLNNMGSIHKIRGETPEAIEFYQTAIAAEPHLVEPFNNLGTIFLQQQEFQKAIEYLYHAIKLSPTFIAAHCNIGLALLGLNQYDDALLYFTKTLQINPDYAEAYYGIAKSHLHKHHFIEAEKNIRQAITLNFHQTEFHQLLAEIYCEQSKHRQALTSLDHALSIDSTLTGLYISKGSVLMEMGEISKAEEQFSKMMYDPSINTRILAYYSLVQLRKNLPNSKLINELLSINTHDVCKSKLPYLYFALGKCHDDIGEWSKAFEYFNKGCYLKRESITYNINEHIQFTQKLIDCFSKNTIEYFRQFANSSKLPIFIVGMPRSGTTLVEQILARHPNICAGGELPYLNDLIQTPVEHHKIKLHYPENILKLSPSNIVNQYLYYLRCISSNADHITDKMPSNFITLGLIHALFPNAKIIHVKRNAIDTCLSCYTKLFSQGHLYSYDLIELGHYYHCYDLIMQHWQNILPPHSFLEINYENIVDNLEMEAKRLIDYCNLPWNSACLTFYHSKRQIRTASFMQVRQPIYRSSVNRWHRFENELAPLLKILNIKIRQ